MEPRRPRINPGVLVQIVTASALAEKLIEDTSASLGRAPSSACTKMLTSFHAGTHQGCVESQVAHNAGVSLALDVSVRPLVGAKSVGIAPDRDYRPGGPND